VRDIFKTDVVAYKWLCECDSAVGEWSRHWIEFLVSVSQWGLVTGLAAVSVVDLAVDGVMDMEEDLAKEVEHSLATRVSNSFSLDLMLFFG